MEERGGAGLERLVEAALREAVARRPITSLGSALFAFLAAVCFLPDEGQWLPTQVRDMDWDALKKRGMVLIFSDLFDDLASLELGLKHLKHRRHDVLVLQVIDPAEREFDFKDLTLFKGLESFAPQLVDTRAIRTAYCEEFQRFLSETATLCRDLRIDHALVPTDEPLDRTLRTLLGHRLKSSR